MKKLIFSLSLLLMAFILQGQTPMLTQTQVKGQPPVQSSDRNMSQGNNPALIVELKKTDKKVVESAWAKYIKDYKGKTKSLKKTGEIFSDDAKIEKMSNNTVDVYAKVMEKGEDTELMVWFDLGGAYLSAKTHANRYPVGVQMLQDFRMSISTAAMEEEIKEQESVLKKMTNDLDGLKKDETNLEADIVKYEKKIEEARQKITEAQAAQKAKASEIESQQVIVKDMIGKLKSLK